VLGDRLLCDVDLRRELPDGPRAVAKQLQDLDAPRLTESPECRGRLRVRSLHK